MTIKNTSSYFDVDAADKSGSVFSVESYSSMESTIKKKNWHIAIEAIQQKTPPLSKMVIPRLRRKDLHPRNTEKKKIEEILNTELFKVDTTPIAE